MISELGIGIATSIFGLVLITFWKRALSIELLVPETGVYLNWCRGEELGENVKTIKMAATGNSLFEPVNLLNSLKSAS